MKKITAETLESMGACRPEVMMMREKHPGGLTPAAFIEAIPRGDWLIWYLHHSGKATIEQVILLGTIGPRRALRFARAENKSVCLAAIEAAEAVAFSNTLENRAKASEAARAEASSAAWAALAAEHLEIANDMRALMRTKKYKSLSKESR